jgi:radical SAM protein with 4Fe4S-binding SPASM domain
MCPNSQRRNKKVEPMTEELFDNITSEIVTEAPFAPMLLLYLQNEPLLDKDLFNKIKHVHKQTKRKIRVGFLTNGTLFNEENIHELEQLPDVFVSISVDAFTKDTYDSIRRGLDFKTVLDNIDLILKSRFDSNHLVVEFTMQKNNICEFNDFKSYWQDKTGGILVNYLTNRSGDLNTYNTLFSPKEAYSLVDTFKLQVIKKMLPFCPLPFTSFFILSNGDVLFCREDWNQKIVLGNLYESSIKDIWNSDQYQKLRNHIYHKRYDKIPVCAKCSRWKNGYFQVF